MSVVGVVSIIMADLAITSLYRLEYGVSMLVNG